ncbi:MAG: hypothetical protein CO183_01780 [Candidatus Zambryskibacteria bacterium CG_4_9_14_3_um_filter_42_9]|uniref:Uncharacterized protein n=1 Tax=Candidatus Zambryskibacteria bacterium CG22_combo_CG10-13_8_21_14_all_42_17 TaxID=1975118 RepID=A0A2H0BE19_9BACT|nr:MAG: hypothetical protein COX06_00810 [Candidatus Zambryskibacteria bacterium CG22_combo_CG10-13_8_21_14_all_42_17]PJA36792.1 MAG: hypothetical protein CO183_01780 [Candidatus Zambryskibacteria bacterium CG_4_9_14_3_um_filter_42_9]
MTKEPWLAAVLNIILGGLGYLYVGKRKLFGGMILAGELFIYVWLFTEPNVRSLLTLNMWAVIGNLLWLAALGMDAYNDAKTI